MSTEKTYHDLFFIFLYLVFVNKKLSIERIFNVMAMYVPLTAGQKARIILFIYQLLISNELI